MVSKDILKEFLFDTVGFNNRKERVAIAIASIKIMNHCAEAQLSVGQSIIMESNFENLSKPELIALIEKYKPKTIIVNLCTDIQVLFKSL
jgi:hypothetical protein